MKTIACAAFACMLLAAADKTQVDTLNPIPKGAELVCQAAGEKSEFGVPSAEIYVADAKGDHRVQITHDRKIYNHIAVSPDRTMVAAGRYDNGDTNKDGAINAKDKKTLMVLDLENKREWAIVPQADDAGLGGVDWTPDGKYIITAMRFGRDVDIYRVHPDGTGLENLTKNLGGLLKTVKPIWVSDVSVSFDGQWIVFTSMIKNGDLLRIARQRIDGTEAHYVTDGGGTAAQNGRSTWGSGDFDPEFSPDGQYVSFQRTTPAGIGPQGFPTYDVMRIKIDGTDLLSLSPKGNKSIQGISDWSRDNRIVFSEWNTAEGWTGPVLVNPDGSNYHRIEKLKGCAWVRWIPPLG